MITSEATQVGSLVTRLDDAVTAGSVGTVTCKVKDVLTDLISSGGLQLPERYHGSRPESYARRLLHRDPDGRYSVVVMTWGPGQGTPLHDHAGMWCVEAVAAGAMEVVQYDLLEHRDGLYRFEHRGQVQAGLGSSGCLVPPFEYHVLRNAHLDRPSITIHVYGGEMNRCSTFTSRDDGLYRREQRELSFHD